MKWIICAIVLACLSGCGIEEQVVRVSVPDFVQIRSKALRFRSVRFKTIVRHRFSRSFRLQRVTKMLGVLFAVAAASM